MLLDFSVLPSCVSWKTPSCFTLCTGFLQLTKLRFASQILLVYGLFSGVSCAIILCIHKTAFNNIIVHVEAGTSLQKYCYTFIS